MKRPPPRRRRPRPQVYTNIVMENADAGDLAMVIKERQGQLLPEDDIMRAFVQVGARARAASRGGGGGRSGGRRPYAHGPAAQAPKTRARARAHTVPAAWRADRPPSLPNRAARRQVALALLYVHSKGIMHRDLKPSNVLVTSAGLLKLGDFGVSKIARGGEDGRARGGPGAVGPRAAG